jgi:hypothetical protein
MRPIATRQTYYPRPVVEPDGTVRTRHEEDARVLCTHRQAIVTRDGAQLAVAEVIDRVCVPYRGYDLPRLVRFLEILDERFAVEVSDIYELRRERRPSPTSPEPVMVVLADGSRTTCEIRPPFAIEGPKRDASFLLKEVTTDT